MLGAVGLQLGPTLPLAALNGLPSNSREPVMLAGFLRDPQFKTHMLRTILPTLQKLLYIRLDDQGDRGKAAIMVVDPKVSQMNFRRLMPALSELSLLAKGVLDARLDGLACPVLAVQEMQEPRLQFGESSDMVGGFLLETLAQRTKLHTRQSVRYTTLRTWRAPMKSYQLNAIKLLKEAPTATFVNAAASEIVRAARSLVGQKNIAAVTHVPCGHSTGKCFAQEIAQVAAGQLASPYVELFDRQQRRGVSHPRRNASLPPLTIRSDVLASTQLDTGTLLLVDDIATTGTHLVRAIEKIKAHVHHCCAIAWIGDK
ncbi:MAG: hypothetical protein R3D67_11140 [Hyphomicrobiaceae bacterium]